LSWLAGVDVNERGAGTHPWGHKSGGKGQEDPALFEGPVEGTDGEERAAFCQWNLVLFQGALAGAYGGPKLCTGGGVGQAWILSLGALDQASG
jgi:hypothetical protein